MRIINEVPPNLDQIHAAGLFPDLSKTIFTYGDAIYNPAGKEVPKYLVAHEETHAEQQARMPGGPEAWWRKYLSDPAFRISQEAEAYATQLRYMARSKKNLGARMRILLELGHVLAGSTYGKVIAVEDAIKLIRERSGVI